MLHSKKTEVGWKRNRLCFSQNKTFLKQRRFTTNLTAETPKTEQLDPLKKSKSFVDPSEKISSRKPLREIISNIYVHEVLAGKKKEIIEVKENIMTFDAIRTMSQKKVGAIIVTKNEPKKREMAGIFSERDYLRKIILKDLSSKNTPLSVVMTPFEKVVTAEPNWTIVDCIREMATKKNSSLPIINENSVAVGMVSSRDVVRCLVNSIENSSDADLAASISLNDIFNKLCRRTSRLCYVQENQSVYDSLKLMENQNIGAVFVNNGTNLVGIFSERDYLNKIILQGRSSKETKVEDVMTKNVITGSPTQSAVEVLRCMVTYGFRNLPVIPLMGTCIDYSDGREYETIGMLTELDVIKFVWLKLKTENK